MKHENYPPSFLDALFDALRTNEIRVTVKHPDHTRTRIIVRRLATRGLTAPKE